MASVLYSIRKPESCKFNCSGCWTCHGESEKRRLIKSGMTVLILFDDKHTQCDSNRQGRRPHWRIELKDFKLNRLSFNVHSTLPES